MLNCKMAESDSTKCRTGDLLSSLNKRSSSKVAFAQGMSVADILAVADWSSDSMFKKQYYRPVIRQNLSFSWSFVHN